MGFITPRQQLERIGHQVERSHHSSALLAGLRMNGGGVFGAFEPLRQFLLVAQDGQQFVRRPLGIFCQQVRKDLAGHNGEERIATVIVLE